MRRNLKGQLTRAEARQDGVYFVELDHQGPKGFVTRFKLSPQGDGTGVEMTTYINQPPWPFRGVYFKKILPAWQQCHADTIKTLDALVLAR